jgi:hypothetical protein
MFNFISNLIGNILQLIGFITVIYMAVQWYIQNFGTPDLFNKKK